MKVASSEAVSLEAGWELLSNSVVKLRGNKQNRNVLTPLCFSPEVPEEHRAHFKHSAHLFEPPSWSTVFGTGLQLERSKDRPEGIGILRSRCAAALPAICVPASKSVSVHVEQDVTLLQGEVEHLLLPVRCSRLYM